MQKTKIKSVLFPSLKLASRFFLWLIAFTLLVFIIADIAIWQGIRWTRTPAGQAWLQNQIATLTEDSSIEISFDRLSYHPALSLKTETLRLSDKDGEFLFIDEAVLRADIFPLALRTFSLDFLAKEITLSRLPAPSESEKKEETGLSLEGFSVPDIFFNKFRLQTDVKRFRFEDSIDTGLHVLASLSLQDERLTFTSLAKTKQQAENFDPNFPEQICLDFELHPETLFFVLHNFCISNKEIYFSANGEGNTDKIHLLSSTRFLSKKEIEPFFLELDIEDILDTPSGAFNLSTRIKEGSDVWANPALKGNFLFKEDTLSLHSLDSTFPDIHLSGGITLNTQTLDADGEITLDIKTLSAYKDLIGDFEAKGFLSLEAQSKEDRKNIVLTLKNFQTTDIHLEHFMTSLHQNRDGDYNLTTETQGEIISLNNLPVSLRASTKMSSDFSSFNDINATLKVLKNSFDIKGSYTPDKIDIEVLTKKLSPDELLEKLAPETPLYLENVFMDAQLNLKGKPDNVDIILDTKISLPEYDMFLSSLSRTENAELVTDLSLTRQGKQELTGDIKIPFVLSLVPFSFNVSKDTPLDGRIKSSIEISEIGKIFLPPTQELSGILALQATLQGTIQTPDIEGTLTLQNGTVLHQEAGLDLIDVVLNAFIKQEKITLQNLSARDRRNGSLTGNGFIILPFQDKALQSDLKLEIQSLTLEQSTSTHSLAGLLSASLRVLGQDSDFDLKGDIHINNLNISLVEKFGISIPSLNIIDEKTETTTPFLLNLDVKLNAENRVFVRGWGLDAEFGGKLDITGTNEKPLINGDFKSIRGRFEEFRKRFDLTRAELRFQGEVPPSPYFNIVATTRASDIQASINLSGSIENPRISFSSVPSMPEDEVLSFILFGRNMNSISPFQAIQLAQTMRRFSGQGGGPDPLSALRDATGLDDLRIDNDEQSGVSVGVGKYLNDKTYLEFKTGQSEGSSSATLQYEIRPNLTLETEVGQDARTGGGLFWKRDY